MRIAICDDDQESMNLLCAYLDRYRQEENVDFTIVKFNNGIDFISDYTADYDVVFMDVRMPLMSGMEVAKKLRKLDESVVLIFVTNLAKYAIKGYEVNAFDFIVKPVNYYSFKSKMTRALATAKREKGREILIKTDVGFSKINVCDIYYACVTGRYVTLKTKHGDFEYKKSMKETELMLKGDSFVRCDNSYLVNLAHVTNIDKNDALVAGDKVPVSRAKRKFFVNAFTLFAGNDYYG